VQPLSAYLNKPAPPAAPKVGFPKINKELMKSNFFEYLDFALQNAQIPPGRLIAATSWKRLVSGSITS
jgi:hypothetical protein